MDYYTMYLLGAIVIGILIYKKYTNWKDDKKNTIRLKDNWGKGEYLKYKEGDLENISSYFKINRSEGYYVDDITWNDLEMNEVFKKLNHGISSIGEEYLYYILRTPVFDEKTLEYRHQEMEMYQENEENRIAIQKLMQKLGKRRDISVADAIYSPLEEYRGTIPMIVLRALSLLSILSPIILIIRPEVGIMLLFTLYPLNMWIHFKARNHIDKSITSIRYMINLIQVAKKCGSRFNNSGAKKRLKDLYKELKILNSLRFKFLYPSNATDDILGAIFDYLRIFTLVDLFMYNKMVKIIDEKRIYIKELYDILGEADALMALASYRAGLEEYCLPTFHKGEELLNFENSYHPLLAKPIKNSLYNLKSILITGANASGKSTFLKTIGINQIFAQTFNTTLATKYETKMIRLYSAMSVKDNILQNESYYIAEIKAVKRIIDRVQKQDHKVLCIVDELLKGTNTKERIVGAYQILRYLLKYSYVCAATHDIELTELLKAQMDNYHFQSMIAGDEIVFDYLIKQGKSMDTNAIELLRVFDFDEEIITKSKEMLRDGV